MSLLYENDVLSDDQLEELSEMLVQDTLLTEHITETQYIQLLKYLELN